jgi:hypothetical protein
MPFPEIDRQIEPTFGVGSGTKSKAMFGSLVTLIFDFHA